MATLADALRQTGYAQNGTLGTPAPVESPMTKVLAEHLASLPQKFNENQAHQMDLLARAYPGNTFKSNMLEGDPKAMAELAMQAPVVGMTKSALSAAERMLIAQRNAALPVSEGGLGLAANNTATQRAKALGFTDEAYHGTNADIRNFDPMMADSRRGTGTPMGSVVVSSEPKTASTYAGEKPTEWIKAYSEGGNVMPLLINKGKNMSMNARQGEYTPGWKELYHPKYPDLETTNDFAAIAKEKNKQSATIKNVKDNAITSGAEGDTTFIFDPALIRSRFAAFDPKRVKEADLLAAGLAVPMPEEKKSRKQIIEEELNKKK